MKVFITPLAKHKIRKKYKKDHGRKAKVDFRKVHETIESIIRRYESEYPSKSVFLFIGNNGLDAGNTPFSSEKACIIDFYWMHLYSACFGTSPLREQMFAETLGHELGHNKFHPVCDPLHMVKIMMGKKTGKAAFIFQTVEVFCDFNAKRMLGSSNEEIRDIVEEKIALYKSIKKKDKDTGDLEHPSHERRCKYLSTFNSFSNEVIEAIANDVGYTDKVVIENTCKKYKDLLAGGQYGNLLKGRLAYLGAASVFIAVMLLISFVAVFIVTFLCIAIPMVL